MDPVEAPACANQLHVRVERGEADPIAVCSCAAGLIHMHDCPVTAGLDCSHFQPLGEEPRVVSPVEGEEIHARLMADYLTRNYVHRIRSLAPAGDPWRRRREELYAFYATVELGEERGEDVDDEKYERERERLIAQRKKREEARAAREERTREEKAKERARLGIKTVVERAQEAVAARGDTASIVDDVKLPDADKKKSKRKRRRRRKKPEDKAAPSSGGAAPKKKRRRRRRRRRPGGGGGDGSSA